MITVAPAPNGSSSIVIKKVNLNLNDLKLFKVKFTENK